MIQYISQIKEERIDQEITKELFNQLIIQIGEGLTVVQKGLLNALKEIALFGAQIIEQYSNNRFFDLINTSGLLTKIVEILQKETIDHEKLNNEDNYSQFFLDLVQTLAFINKNQEFDKQIVIICGKVLSSNIKKLIKNLKMKSAKNDPDINNQNQNDDELNNEIQQGINSLKALEFIEENEQNCKIFCTELKMHEIITPFIHINCSDELNCSSQISLTGLNLINELQANSLITFGELAWRNDNSRGYLLKNNREVIEHMIPIIISFSKIQQNKNKNNSPIINSSLSLISQQHSDELYSITFGALNLLYGIIRLNDQLYQQITSPNDLISSLINLASFERKIHENKKNDIKRARIRETSNICLQWIWFYASQDMKKRLVSQYGYAKYQIEGIIVAGGNEEESIEIVYRIIFNIIEIFERLNQESELHPSLIYSKIEVEDQIENEGGIEELNSHIFHQCLDQKDEWMVYFTNSLMTEMSYARKDPSNIINGQ